MSAAAQVSFVCGFGDPAAGVGGLAWDLGEEIEAGRTSSISAQEIGERLAAMGARPAVSAPPASTRLANVRRFIASFIS